MMTLTRLFNETLTLFKPNIGKLFVYNLLIFVVGFIGGGLGFGAVLIAFGTGMLSGNWSAPANWYFVALAVCVLAIIMICTTVITIAMTRVIHKLYTKQSVGTLKQELLATRGIIIPTLLATILYILIVLGGSLLLIIPGIIFSVWFAFSAMGIVLDNKRVRESFTFSRSLVQGRFFKTLVYIAIPFLVIAVFQGIVSFVIHIPDAVAPNSLSVVTITTILDMAVSMLIAPLSTIPFIVLYEELKKNPVTPAVPPQM